MPTLRIAVVSLVVGGLIAACTPSPPSPRERVIEFFGVVHSDSLPSIGRFVDVDSVSYYEYRDPQYDSLTAVQKQQRLIRGFLGEGEYRRTWGHAQIVVNQQRMVDDTSAAVEVSIIDRSTRIQYLTWFGLKLREQQWMITNFKIE